jgi:hypothetical protein
MSDLAKLGATGVAIYLVSMIGSYLLPVPHAYAGFYTYFLGPAGGFAGYGVANFVVKAADKRHVFWWVVVAAAAIIGAVLCGFGYYELYRSDQSPPVSMRVAHAILYAFAFAFFFFTVRWAGFLLELKKKDDGKTDDNKDKKNKEPSQPEDRP